ncbi:oxysterol-binding protein-related protein 9 isoform X2 [Condylostylus longicornis]|uniref:oxysterol-binding protein-related protein 9 isoform X2 n=1 Tax=Condylostylus longicornis TaxID=2530218 RepID=UPI00244E5048|nr:oxysterol-binding protein-related protein 9 isoform X2 [Condylostylus longicornis]
MLEGTLSKWTNVMKGWQYRYVILEENAGLFSYYTSKEKMMKGVRRGCVRLKGAVIGIDDQEDNTFTITVDHKTFHFQARDGDEREKWVRKLEDTIRRHAYRGRLWDYQSSYYGSDTGLTNPSATNQQKKANLLQLLDKRVSEADAYLQLIIEQTSKIDERIENITDPEEKAKCKSLQESASAMVDHIKHSIVTLQIAKNMAHPINGIYQGPSTVSPDSKTESSSNNHGDSVVDDDIAAPAISLVVPETSYSSSEGEDDFYDANDDMFNYQTNTPIISATRGVSFSTSTTTEPTVPPVTDITNKNETESVPSKKDKKNDIKGSSQDSENSDAFATPSKVISSALTDGRLDYDALYEDEDDTDLSMESHGSVVSHLLSQVKIGMDLTKVVLPTFILERRSLLEMYADYFAHPDLFLRIVDLDDPKDRMVQVVRWYLSSYHAGRKSTVAKKPYNPILGEIFRCHWDIPGDPDDEIVTDGPIPWCRKDQLTFLAEQVSHHPPISAFYAEHYNKKISFLAHVWTKSKFLGLSIGVHNIGQGIVTLCDRNEEYILTFPNGYGRSILTVPWIELGGSVTIKCPQTGHYADVEFLTKPFYGGKKNRITAEIFSPNEKKPFVSVAGEWSGLMEAKWNDGSRHKPEVFIDVNEINIHKKLVRPIAEQEDCESRKVWKEVTAGLKLNDIERATSAKYLVEQKQREEAKTRKDCELNWNTKYFKPVGENWIYTNPLSQRLYLQEKENKR